MPNVVKQEITIAGIKYRLSLQEDLDKIRELLQRSDLPVEDVDENKIVFIVATHETNSLIGCIGLEQYGPDGLLRSMAVDPAYRNSGIGHELFNHLLSVSRQNNITTLHLLTTTAEKYFSRSGFLKSARNDAPASIQATEEFSSLCPSSSAYMVMNNIQNKIFK